MKDNSYVTELSDVSETTAVALVLNRRKPWN